MKNKWKIAFFTCLTLLIILSVCSAYMVINQAVSYTYLSDSLDKANRDQKLLIDLIPKDTSKKDLVFMLRQARPDELIVEKDSLVHINGLTFVFAENDTIKSIETYMSENSFYPEQPIDSL